MNKANRRLPKLQMNFLIWLKTLNRHARKSKLNKRFKLSKILKNNSASPEQEDLLK